jgi:hypothetical protein
MSTRHPPLPDTPLPLTPSLTAPQEPIIDTPLIDLHHTNSIELIQSGVCLLVCEHREGSRGSVGLALYEFFH